jgi:ring-1,2-phenylacetyl-CoA epoxidase subunit PaaC
MKPDIRQAFADYLLALADDELILGHRDSEWCGHAPILEEDIAFANIALDEIGHAQLWYTLLAELLHEDPQTYPDQLVYRRNPEDFRNARMLELPNGDWAFSMLRQYLFDTSELVRMNALANSHYQALAGAASQVRKEELYHLRHTRAWINRLALGTEESHRRLQNALSTLWPLAQQLFQPHPAEEDLVAEGLIPDSAELITAWRAQVLPDLQVGNLELPSTDSALPSRRDHSKHLKVMVHEMQSVVRLDPQAQW